MSAARWAVRIFARWTDDPTECPFAFDLILDQATGLAYGDWPIFGATDLDSPQARPFLLDAAGELNFGSADRRWRTDLRQRRLFVGSHILVWWTPEDWASYEIVKIAALGGRDKRLRFLTDPTEP